MRLTPVYRKRVGRYDEFVYVDRDFWVTALTDELEQVQFYSVTTRSKKFKPPLWPNNVSSGSSPRPPMMRLLTQTFDEIAPELVSGIDLFVRGATRPTHYIECAYLGNPGLYQHYYVGLNELGPFDFDPESLHALLGRRKQLGALAAVDDSTNDEPTVISDWLDLNDVRTFRSSAKPNAYAVSGPGFLPRGEYEVYLGPDPVQMRTLLE